MAYNHYDFLPQPYCAQVPGIYAIVNRNNNKLYIGSAAQLNKRWTCHRHDFHRRRQNPHLLRAFEKDREAFYLEVVEELPGADKQKRLEREQFWINFYQSHLREHGYNMSPKAESCEGIVRTQEFRDKMSARSKGVKWSEERKAHFRKVRKIPRGWKWSEERRKKQSLSKKGGKWSPRQRIAFEATIKHRPLSGKAVMQFATDGTFIKRFGNIEAAESAFGKRSNIHSVCNGKRRTAFGFVWRYASDATADQTIHARPKTRRKDNRRIQFACIKCGTPYEKPPSKAKGSKYCSMLCSGRARGAVKGRVQ